MIGRIATLGTLVFVSVAAWAAAPAFDEVDANRDGVLSQSEASQVEGLDFEAADANEDGVLTRGEYEAATG